MRFTRLELLNWDIQANQVVVLQPGVNLLTGENGSGKTTLLDAMKVVLGGTRIGGDRSVEDYLALRGAPFAMVRLVADNTPDERRRRPFDAVQPSEEDLFTLAVVFEASEDGYTPRWYFLPGDVSPLQRGFGGRAFTTRSDYTARLDRLGMGRSFRKLLCTPQGQVASLCTHQPRALFDLLFDFIGGKQVLDDWESLRRDFERQQRNREERGAVLQRREADLDGLRNVLRAHERFRSHLDRMHLARRALPIARLAEAQAALTSLQERIHTLEALEAAAVTEVGQATETLDAVAAQQAQADQRAQTLTATGAALDETWRALESERATYRAQLDQLERLRTEAEGLEPQDLEALRRSRTAAEDRQAELRAERRVLAGRMKLLQQERERLDEGLLSPPPGVDAFRAVLRNHEVPHHLLMDLIEPQSPNADTRRALESYLGEVRFAVAVPDRETFVRAVALAREHRFPYYVLAPDVRSPTPTFAHPFLDHIKIRDPKYRGLVIRVLRAVRWLEGDVEDTHRERTILVDPSGFVLDRKGGRFQGTDRYYLGREALVRRRAQLESELATCTNAEAELITALADAGQRRHEANEAIALEIKRLEWEEQRAQHSTLVELLDQNQRALHSLERERSAHHVSVQASTRHQHELVATRVREQERRRRAQNEAQEHQHQIAQSRRTLGEVEQAVAAATSPDEADAATRAFAEVHGVAVLEAIEATAAVDLTGFRASERDPNLPSNVETLEKQVEDVRGELARLDIQVDQAQDAAERAHEQYKIATRRVFRRYFASLIDAGEPLGFKVEGALRPRDDGRFAVDVKVAAGAKDLVPYSSPSLSGGQKAALSMLMAMTTLRVHNADGGPGFFLIDEPFSASDTHKIQELGTFLERTGAQYLVSMPTTEELRRCGSWLQAVLTCTQTPGGRDAEGQLRIAPPVKCSYVMADD